MKAKEELNALKAEVEALNKKLRALTEEELAEVTGAPFTYLIGKPDLLIEEIPAAPGPCKYRISRHGEYMGWTIRNNLQYIG